MTSDDEQKSAKKIMGKVKMDEDVSTKFRPAVQISTYRTNLISSYIRTRQVHTYLGTYLGTAFSRLSLYDVSF